MNFWKGWKVQFEVQKTKRGSKHKKKWEEEKIKHQLPKINHQSKSKIVRYQRHDDKSKSTQAKSLLVGGTSKIDSKRQSLQELRWLPKVRYLDKS